MTCTSVWGFEKLHFDIIPPIRGHRNMPWERKSADTNYPRQVLRTATIPAILAGCTAHRRCRQFGGASHRDQLVAAAVRWMGKAGGTISSRLQPPQCQVGIWLQKRCVACWALAYTSASSTCTTSL